MLVFDFFILLFKMVKFGALMISGIILVVLGIILLALGIVFIFTGSGRSKEWWVWLLIILGIILIIVGIVLILLGLKKPKTSSKKDNDGNSVVATETTQVTADGTKTRTRTETPKSYTPIGNDDDDE